MWGFCGDQLCIVMHCGAQFATGATVSRRIKRLKKCLSVLLIRWSKVAYRIAVGTHQGRKVFTLQTLPACDEPYDNGVAPTPF